MTATVVVPVVDEGLGNSAYLVDLGMAGHSAVAVLSAGPPDWAEATGMALESTA